MSSLQPRALTRTLFRLVPSQSSTCHVLLPFPKSQFRPESPPQELRAGCKQKTAASRRVQGTLCAPAIVLVPL